MSLTIVLKPEQERILIEAINSGVAHTTDEALDQALDALRARLPRSQASVDESIAAAARRLATFGKRHGLTLGGLTIKELLVGERRKRLTPELIQAFIADLDRLQVDVDDGLQHRSCLTSCNLCAANTV